MPSLGVEKYLAAEIIRLVGGGADPGDDDEVPAPGIPGHVGLHLGPDAIPGPGIPQPGEEFLGVADGRLAPPVRVEVDLLEPAPLRNTVVLQVFLQEGGAYNNCCTKLVLACAW